MPLEFKSVNGFLSSQVWLMANIIQMSTYTLCPRFYTKDNDPCGRMFDQMTMAARSTTANIAEGLSRAQTSKETELKLLDVARASVSELQNDYFFICCQWKVDLWDKDSKEFQAVWAMEIPKPKYGSYWLRDANLYVRQLMERFKRATLHDDMVVALNSMIILTERCKLTLERMMNTIMEDFRIEGGFTEAMSKERIQARAKQAVEEGAPLCPLCGQKMIKRHSFKGAGKTFWSCSQYPSCRGWRPGN